MKIRKGDTVLIISGKDRNKKGNERVLIEAVNLRKKHLRPKKTREKGQLIEMAKEIV